MKLKLLGISLSLRKDSCNKKLIKLAEHITTESNMEMKILDLLDYNMPPYNEDVEHGKGFPEKANELKEKIENSHGIIIASPEYNASYPGNFKNTFDWISRYRPMPWNNKTVLLLSASPSLVGGERSLWHLKAPFEICGAFVYSRTFSLPLAYQAFNEKNHIADPEKAKKFSDLVVSFIGFTRDILINL